MVHNMVLIIIVPVVHPWLVGQSPQCHWQWPGWSCSGPGGQGTGYWGENWYNL